MVSDLLNIARNTIDVIYWWILYYTPDRDCHHFGFVIYHARRYSVYIRFLWSVLWYLGSLGVLQSR